MTPKRIDPATRKFLCSKAELYEHPDFIVDDPISVPHLFSKKQDIEIAGFFAAILAWGQRTTIIKNSRRLMQWMDNAPHDFLIHHAPKDLKPFLDFKHRTFNADDLLYFIHRLSLHYQNTNSLESAFVPQNVFEAEHVETALRNFYDYFFSEPHLKRTEKHVATPAKNSACKRLCMYLRWMVRPAEKGVDFGLWKRIKPSQLICPCDLHVDRVGRKLGLITRKQTDWKTALELTQRLREFDPNDPVKYDFALFGLGVEEKF